MINDQSLSSFYYSLYINRRKQRDFYHEQFVIGQKTNIQSTVNNRFTKDSLQQIAVQPSTQNNLHDYLYIIYFLLLIIFYVYYTTFILRASTYLSDKDSDDEQYHYFDNYERQMPFLLWFRKGYQLC